MIATASPASYERVRAHGAEHLVDYDDERWPQQVVRLAAGVGVGAAANLVRGGAAQAIRAAADGGRLATITSDPPPSERGIAVSSVYV